MLAQLCVTQVRYARETTKGAKKSNQTIISDLKDAFISLKVRIFNIQTTKSDPQGAKMVEISSLTLKGARDSYFRP